VNANRGELPAPALKALLALVASRFVQAAMKIRA
jgi:hypothetical protein